MQPLKMFFYYLIEVMPWYRFPNYFCQLPPTSYLAVSSGQIGTHTHAHACARVHTHTHTHTHTQRQLQNSCLYLSLCLGQWKASVVSLLSSRMTT